MLAIVKLKEEELEKEELARKRLHECHQGDSEDPTLTRAKAKALNKLPLPLAPITHSEPNSEVVALIHDDLRSDDEDEEYQPGDEEIDVS